MDGSICYVTSGFHQKRSTCRAVSFATVVMVVVIGCVVLSEVTSSVILIS